MSGEPPKKRGERVRTEIRERLHRAHLPPLSVGTRIVVFVIGWSLVLVGILGLVLPGIQGILTILLGAALLSLVSESAYRLLKRLFKRWPWAIRKIDALRHKVHGWFHRE